MRNLPFLGGHAASHIVAGDGFYDTAELLTLISQPRFAPQLRQFWLQFFPGQHNSDREKIYFDEIDENEYRLAPFVAPMDQGKIMAAKGFLTESFKPAYVKPKHVVDPFRALTRRAGESLLGSQSIQQRRDAIVVDNIRREREMIENRWEWMACKAVTDGQITIVGENYPTTVVDFRRDASLTNILAGAALWSANTATPIDDLNTMNQLSFKFSRAPITKAIFGLEAWANFILPTHGDVQGLLNAFVIGNESRFNSSGINNGEPFQYMGYLQGTGGLGRLDMYTYSNFYESLGDNIEDAGAAGEGQPYFDPKCVIGVGGRLNGVKAFGAILDMDSMSAVPMFPKSWTTEDPSVRYTMTQSAPLMVPLVANNSWKMKVVA